MKYIIFDTTCNNETSYLHSDGDLCSIENAMEFDTRSESDDYIMRNKLSNWALTIEV